MDYGNYLSESDFKINYLKPLLKIGDGGILPQLFFGLRDFDLIHLHFPFYGSGFLVYLAAVFWKIPLLVTYHMDASPKGVIKKTVKYFSDYFFSNLIFKTAKRVILVDAGKKQFKFLKNIVPQKLITLNNVIDTKIFFPQNIKLSDLNLEEIDGKRILLFVGNLLPLKRLDLILQALSILRRDDLVLLVVGDGYERKNYEDLSRQLKLDKQVYFVGQISDQRQLAKYYSVADFTVIPSDYESFSLVAIESMACATPVIASRLAALEDKIQLGNTGLLFNSGDGGDLAKKIIEALNYSKEELGKLKMNCKKHILVNNDLDEHLSKLLEIYRHTI
jgi:glycosyltransferase involved in cell wall biosynthesis